MRCRGDLRRRALSLVEVLVASVIVLVGVGAILMLLTTSRRETIEAIQLLKLWGNLNEERARGAAATEPRGSWPVQRTRVQVPGDRNDLIVTEVLIDGEASYAPVIGEDKP